MLKCPICTVELEAKFRRTFIHHLNKHSSLNEINWPFKCAHLNCSNTFWCIKAYNKHLECHVDNKIEYLDRVSITNNNNFELTKNNDVFMDYENTQNQLENCIDEDDSKLTNEMGFKSNETAKKEIENKAFKLVNHFRSKNQLSYTLLNEIIKLFGDFINDLISIIKTQTFNLFDINEKNKNKYEDFYSEIMNPFDFISSSYKQQNLLESTELYVVPKSINMGKREDPCTIEGNTKIILKDATFEYVSIYETLEVLVRENSFREALKVFNNSNEVGTYFNEHELFKDQKNLRIILYYDDLEMCNPLGDTSGIYKGGMFYFTVSNLTRKHYSNLRNIFLTAVCHSEDLRTFGYNSVLKLIMADIKKLETTGLNFDINNKLRGSIAQCIGDNLGIHQIFGLQQKFSGMRICLLCDANTDKSQNYFHESNFNLHDTTTYGDLITQGVYKNCVLNESRYFNILNYHAFDLTHDLWLGVVPIELSLVLTSLIKEKVINIDFVNSRIKSYNYGSVDASNKPNLIYMIDGSVKIKQKAVKSVCLFKYLPFIIGDKIPHNNKYWELLIQLAGLINILYMSNIDETLCLKLEQQIKDHHMLYRSLYPNTTLKKKHHNMVHYPTSIRMIGSLVDFCTLRFEGKHKFFKKAHQTSNNYKNIPKTVAKKHQIYLADCLINSNLLNKELVVLDGKEIDVRFMNLEVRSCLENDQLTFASSIEYYGQLYKQNNVVSKLNKNELYFYSIVNIIIYKAKILFYAKEYKKIDFSKHYYAHRVQETGFKYTFEISQITHYSPFNLHNSLDSNDKSLYVKSFNF